MKNFPKFPNLSIMEFKDYCDKQNPRRFIVDSENQSWSKIDDTMRIKLVFDKIKINFNPNTIKFSSSSGSVSFDRVEYITACETTLIGGVFDIVCTDRPYTVVVQ